MKIAFSKIEIPEKGEVTCICCGPWKSDVTRDP